MQAYTRIHPAVLTAQFAFILLSVMFTFNPILQMISMLGGILYLIALGKSDTLKESIKYYIIILVITTLTNPLFSHYGQTVLIKIGIFKITFESLMFGAGLGISIIAVMVWCQAYSSVMTTEKYVSLFKGKLPKTALTITITLRYIPMLKRRWQEILSAQRALGMYSYKNGYEKIKFFLICFLALIEWSFENAANTVNSILARSCKGIKRTSCSYYKIQKYDLILLILSVVLFLTFSFMNIEGYTDFEYYPKIKLQNFNLKSLTSVIIFTVMAFIPFFIELKEYLLWKYYRSKI